MKNILVIVGFFDPNNLSALPRIVFEIASKNSDKFRFFICTNGKDDKVYQLDEKITVYEIKSSTYDYKKIKSFIIENNIDLINFHGSLLGSILCIRSLKCAKIPIILNIYEKKANFGDFIHLKFSDFWRAYYRTIGLPFTKSIIMPQYIISYYLSQDIVQKIIVPSARLKKYYQSITDTEVVQIPVGVMFEKFSNPDVKSAEKMKKSFGFDSDDKIIMYFGHSSITRGIDDLIQVFPLIKNKIPKAKLVLVLNSKWSSSSTNDFIVNMAYKYIPSDSVKIIEEHISNPEEYYAIADVLSLVYRFSGEIPEYPFVLLEAMATGAPVISTNIGAIPEIIKNDFNGILIQPKNKRELANAIERILLDEKFSDFLVENAKKTAKLFDWNIATDNICRIYEGSVKYE